MAKTAQFVIGAEVSCSDGACGQLRRVVIDPVAESVTHLVIGQKRPHGRARLVPVDLADATAGSIRLRCTLAEFGTLEAARETHFLPGNGGRDGYGDRQVFTWPYYGIGGRPALAAFHLGNQPQTVTCDAVPPGEVEIRRGDRVDATDGHIGLVQGLVIDPGNHHVTHVLLQEGHLRGRKDVAIPVGAVASTSDGIRLSISKQDVQDLPPVNIDQPDTGAGGQAGHQ
jgi:hypothetical protein